MRRSYFPCSEVELTVIGYWTFVCPHETAGVAAPFVADTDADTVVIAGIFRLESAAEPVKVPP